MRYQRSSILFKEAQKVIAGGVNSPVRAFKSVGGTPIFVEKAKGALLYDKDGNTFLDYISFLLDIKCFRQRAKNPNSKKTQKEKIRVSYC